MSSEDLTARARIRDAALKLFAERGIEKATIRDIAQEAGVSSGLLRHHFGSKEGLRDACDEHAMARVAVMRDQFIALQQLGHLDPEIRLLQAYLMRSLMDGTPTGNALYDRMITYGEEWLASTDLKVTDERAFVAVLSVMKIAMFTMSDHLSRALGEDTRSPSGWTRVINASLELFSQPLVTPEQAGQLREALERLQPPEDQPPEDQPPEE